MKNGLTCETLTYAYAYSDQMPDEDNTWQKSS